MSVDTFSVTVTGASLKTAHLVSYLENRRDSYTQFVSVLPDA